MRTVWTGRDAKERSRRLQPAGLSEPVRSSSSAGRRVGRSHRRCELLEVKLQRQDRSSSAPHALAAALYARRAQSSWRAGSPPLPAIQGIALKAEKRAELTRILSTSVQRCRGAPTPWCMTMAAGSNSNRHPARRIRKHHSLSRRTCGTAVEPAQPPLIRRRPEWLRRPASRRRAAGRATVLSEKQLPSIRGAEACGGRGR